MPLKRKRTYKRKPKSVIRKQIGRKITIGSRIPRPKTFQFIRTAIARIAVDVENGMTGGFMSVPLKATIKNSIQEYSNYQTLFRAVRVAGARFEITMDRNYSSGGPAGYPNVMQKIIPSRLVLNSDKNPTNWLDACNIRGSSKIKYMNVDDKYPQKVWLNAYILSGYPHSTTDLSAVNVAKRCPYLDMTTNKDQMINFGHLLLQTTNFANPAATYEPIITITQYTYFTCAGQTF